MQHLKNADPAALADGHAALRKAFTDLYPNLHISPSDGIAPGSFQRPYLTAGHAAENAAHNGEPNIPASTHTPAPEQFRRPLITDGHQADSPANKADNFDVKPVTGAARTYYTHAQRDKARTALAALHDHIAAAFPDLCPMAASKSVLPPDLGRTNTPAPVSVPAQGGVATVGKTVEGGAATLTVEQLQGIIAESIKRHGERNPAHVPALVPVVPQLTRKQLRKAAASMGLAVTEPQAVSLNGAGQPSQPGLSAAELKALLTEQFTPLAQQYQNQMDDLRKQVDEIGARPVFIDCDDFSLSFITNF